MRKIYILLFVFIGLTQAVWSQDNDSLSMITNRPGNTEASRAVYKRGFQVEGGFGYTGGLNSDFTSVLQLPNLGAIYGVSNNMELRVFTTYLGIFRSSGVGYEFRLPFVTVGTKINLFKRRGALPEMALVIQQSIPTNLNDARRLWSTNEIIAWSYGLGDNFSISGNFLFYQNFLVENNNTDFEFDMGYTLNLGYQFASGFGTFLELYQMVGLTNRLWANFNGGFWLRITPRVQVDMYGGYNFKENSFNIVGGLSWLLLK